MINEKEILVDIIKSIIDSDVKHSDPFWFIDVKWDLVSYTNYVLGNYVIGNTTQYCCTIEYEKNLVIHQKKFYISKSEFDKRVIENRNNRINQIIKL